VKAIHAEAAAQADSHRFTIELIQQADLARVLDQFEDYCIVTQSVRPGFPVDVRVLDRDGAVLRPLGTAA
jgi:hypothetical protein